MIVFLAGAAVGVLATLAALGIYALCVAAAQADAAQSRRGRGER